MALRDDVDKLIGDRLGITEVALRAITEGPQELTEEQRYALQSIPVLREQMLATADKLEVYLDDLDSLF